MTRRARLGRGLGLALAVLAGAAATSACRREISGPEVPLRTIVWQDEFDGPAGQRPDSTKWGYDLGGSGWGNAQLEYDTDRPDNVALDGQGHLVITARREDYLGRAYTSARINTLGRFARTHGRFEARVRLPVGQGIWPAFWLLGGDFATVGWPECGEIDIMEYRGQEPRVVHGSVHGPGYSGGSAITRRFDLPVGTFDGDFHVFAVDWAPERITWLVDGIAYHTVTPANLPAGARWVFERPFFIILNVAVGGNFVGPPDASTVFPQRMTVDYVRVYGTAP
uniref:Glycoside hydrolase family 16 protein n=1 Tax=Eiseniibacteriota bacterium TaxID=2212470 RepID=A0A832MNX6_UNCEI